MTLISFVWQATSALAGLLEEDAIATDESKIIDNAWRGAEVTIQIISLQHTFSHMVLRISLYFRKLDLISFQYFTNRLLLQFSWCWQ